MKKKILLTIPLLILFLLLIAKNVYADSPECYAHLEEHKDSINIGEEFTLNIGTWGAASNIYINEIYYKIEYNKDDVEVVSINGKDAGAYNGWNVETTHYTNTGLITNKIYVHAYTNEKDKMYHSIRYDEFVKIAYVKFRAKAENQKTTRIDLQKDESYYKAILEGKSEADIFNCYDSVFTLVNLISKSNQQEGMLVEVNDNFYYIRDGKVDKSYAGLVKYNNSWYYVKNGNIDWGYTGICEYNGKNYYIKNGKINWEANGLVQISGIWYYFVNGAVQTDYAGLVQYNGSWFYVKSGQIDWSYTGLAQYNGSWFYIKAGKLDWTYTGLVQYNGSWFYVKTGKLDWGYTGLVQYNNSWFYVKAGKLDWSYTGLAQHNESWFYVKAGKLDWSYTGLTQYNESWYYVKQGKLDWSYTGLVPYNNILFYVQNGKINWNYNGDVIYNDETYTFKNGKNQEIDRFYYGGYPRQFMEENNYELIEYGYYDMDNDGWTELIIVTADYNSENRRFYFFAYKDNHIIQKGNVSGYHTTLHILNEKLFFKHIGISQENVYVNEVSIKDNALSISSTIYEPSDEYKNAEELKLKKITKNN